MSGVTSSKDASEPTQDLLKIITINIASIRSAWQKGAKEYIASSDADIICIQETKLYPDVPVPIATFQLPGHHGYFFHCTDKDRKGQAGTAIYTKIKPVSAVQSFEEAEGRVITMEFQNFYLVNSYVPNAGNELDRLRYKIDTWAPKLMAHINKLKETKTVIWTGDLNVAHQEIDIYDPKGHDKTAGFTPDERNWFDGILKSGYVDIFRDLHPDSKEFTFFSYRHNARTLGRGWRLDYFVINKEGLTDGLVKECSIDSGISGFSDHVPLTLLLDRSKILGENDTAVEQTAITIINTNETVTDIIESPQADAEQDETEEKGEEKTEEPEKKPPAKRGRKPKAQKKEEEAEAEAEAEAEEADDDEEEKPRRRTGRSKKNLPRRSPRNLSDDDDKDDENYLTYRDRTAEQRRMKNKNKKGK